MTILGAAWGTLDVTDTAATLVRGDALTIPASNGQSTDSMPGRDKSLVVVYRLVVAGITTGLGTSDDRLSSQKIVIARMSAEPLTGLADMSSGRPEQIKLTVGMVGARLTLGVLQIVD